MEYIYVVFKREDEYEFDDEVIFSTFCKNKAVEYIKRFKALQEKYSDFITDQGLEFEDYIQHRQIEVFQSICHVWFEIIEIR